MRGLQWEWLGGLPPLRTAARCRRGFHGHGDGQRPRACGLDVQLGCGRVQASACARRVRTALPGGSATRARGRPQGGDRDRVRRRGPRGADRALQQPSRRRWRDRRPDERTQRRARGVQGTRTTARHDPHRVRVRARAGPGRGQPFRPRRCPRGDRGRRRGGGRTTIGSAPPAARSRSGR